MAEVNVNAPSPVCIDCGGPKRPGKGARCGSCSGKRRVARRAELMALYEAGQYTPGSYHREATCKGCGRVFPVTRHDNLGCCSRGCASAVVGAARRIYADKREAKRAEHLRARLRKGLPPPLAEVDCVICGAVFRPKNIRARYCSDACRLKAIDRTDRTPRPCGECGVMFSPEYGVKRRRFCSASCLTKNLRRKRRKVERARLRAAWVESVDPTMVFERDGWRCHLCGRRTPRRLRGTLDDRAPELDHIIPLARGGEHSYANTACACRACNMAKGATPKGQILMFASPVG